MSPVYRQSRAALTALIVLLGVLVATHQGGPVRSQDAGLTPVAYLPIVERYGPTFTPTTTAIPTDMPTNTAIATSTRMPTATNTPTQTPIPIQLLPNGDFEQGKTVWMNQESANIGIIDNPPIPVTPHSGTWLSQIVASQDGSVSAELSSPSVVVPFDKPYLSYWYWIRSTETNCSADAGGVVLVQDPSVQTRHSLCATTQTDGWVRTSLNLTAYAGQTVEVLVLAGTFDTDEPDSIIYIDDIGFQALP